MATSVKLTRSRSWSSAARSASSGAAISSFDVSDAGTGAGGRGPERLRGVVDNSVILGAPSGEFVAVARAVDVDADRGHGEPVEDGRRQGRVAEVLAPLAELDIGGEGGGRMLVPAVEQVEEHVRGGGFVIAAAQLAKPDVVDDQPFRAGPFAEPGVVGLIGQARIQVVDQVDAPDVADADLALART